MNIKILDPQTKKLLFIVNPTSLSIEQKHKSFLGTCPLDELFKKLAILPPNIKAKLANLLLATE